MVGSHGFHGLFGAFDVACCFIYKSTQKRYFPTEKTTFFPNVKNVIIPVEKMEFGGGQGQSKLRYRYSFEKNDSTLNISKDVRKQNVVPVKCGF